MKTAKTILTATIATTLLLAAGMANATQRGGQCLMVNSSTFNCAHIGLVKVSEIYEKGFRVVASYINGSVAILIIEEQKP